MSKVLLSVLTFLVVFQIGTQGKEPVNVMVDPHERITHTSDSLSFEFSTSFQTRHIWRGSLTCSAWNIQPSFNLSKKNFLIGAWGAYTIDNSYSEVDLYISYSLGPFNLAVLDYFCPNETVRFNRLFDFNQRTTQHTIDVSLTFEGTKKLPLRIMASTLVYGDDLNPRTGENYYSTYIETAYSFKQNPNRQTEIFLGFTPFEGYYANTLYITNLGFSISQTIKKTENFELPIFGKLILNPFTENLYFVFGLSITTN
jgi:hypothetical protein